MKSGDAGGSIWKETIWRTKTQMEGELLVWIGFRQKSDYECRDHSIQI